MVTPLCSDTSVLPTPCCRACHTEEAKAEVGLDVADQLLSPCLCTGSVQWIHMRCLDAWRIASLRRANRHCCELCGFAFAYEFEAGSALSDAKPFLLVSLASVGALGILAAIVTAETGTPSVGVVAAGAFVGVWACGDVSVSIASCLCADFGGHRAGILGGACRRLYQHQCTKRTCSLSFVVNTDADLLCAPSVAATQRRVFLRSLAPRLCDLLSSIEGIVVLTAGIPAVFTFFLFRLRDMLGHHGLEQLALYLAWLGVLYTPVALGASLLASALTPRPVVVRNDAGLPIVRSLTSQERLQERLALNHRRCM
eukprot:TRINITY_DN61982_c0_g1_i1.p1 TRINITY_DN61982_c0_g1~~TRINITY_DN61982_c0_g1_i1.p1  ORF type:complete len:312 (-),score=29.61 TRINITY_DN61982_c0_g1_i1:31-966(-)